MKIVSILSLLLSFSSFAQVSPNPTMNDIDAKIPLISEVNKKRVNSFLSVIDYLNVESKVYEMKQAGVTTQTYSTAVDLKGKLAELEKGLGMYLAPYTISIATDNRIFLEIGLLKFNTEETQERSNYEFDIDMLSIEYNKNYTYSNTQFANVYFFKPKFTYGIYPFANSGFKIETMVKANVVGFNPTAKVMIGSPTETNFGGIGFSSGVGYGMNLSQNFNNGVKLYAGAEGSNSFSTIEHYTSAENEAKYWEDYKIHSESINLYNQQHNTAMEQWKTDKFNWEVANGYSQTSEEAHYIAMSGNTKPVYNYTGPSKAVEKTENITRNTFMLQPKLGVSKEFSNPTSIVKGVGVEMNANLYFVDKFTGTYTTVDLLKIDGMDRNQYNMKLILKL
jgi:hypothetical protein